MVHLRLNCCTVNRGTLLTGWQRTTLGIQQSRNTKPTGAWITTMYALWVSLGSAMRTAKEQANQHWIRWDPRICRAASILFLPGAYEGPENEHDLRWGVVARGTDNHISTLSV